MSGTIVLAGGGTGGHVYPAIALAEELKNRSQGRRIVFVGTRNRIESRIVPAHGYEFETVWISGLRRKLSAETLLFPVKVLVAVAQSLALLRRVRAAVVVGTGGFVCGPVVFAATLLGIPTVLQEQNSYPGLTTRLLARRVDQVHIAFEAAREHVAGARDVRLSGNPVRSSIGKMQRPDAARQLGIDAGRTTLLVLGGSLGARSMNRAVLDVLESLVGLGVQLVWQTGEQDFDEVMKEISPFRKIVKPYRFIDRMDMAYAVADLVLCRAGATTVAEVLCVGLPSVLVPYPHATADHQTRNAESLVAAGAAEMVPDAEIATRLAPLLTSLVRDAARLGAMREQARRLGRPGAADQIAEAVLDLAKG